MTSASVRAPVYCIVFYHSVEHFFGCLLHNTATSVIIPSDIQLLNIAAPQGQGTGGPC